MPSYKFTYFDLRARGELSRYVFLAAGKDFEDDRVARDDWPTAKPCKCRLFNLVSAFYKYIARNNRPILKPDKCFCSSEVRDNWTTGVCLI